MNEMVEVQLYNGPGGEFTHGFRVHPRSYYIKNITEKSCLSKHDLDERSYSSFCRAQHMGGNRCSRDSGAGIGLFAQSQAGKGKFEFRIALVWKIYSCIWCYIRLIQEHGFGEISCPSRPHFFAIVPLLGKARDELFRGISTSHSHATLKSPTNGEATNKGHFHTWSILAKGRGIQQ